VRRLAILVALAAAACLPGLACGATTGKSIDVTSGRPAGLAARIAQTDTGLRAALREWLRSDASLRSPPPRAVLALAATERAIVHRLSASPALAQATIATLPPGLAASIRLDVAAAVDLRRLDGPPAKHPAKLHLVASPSAGLLLGYYRQAQARFGVRWQVLAAVNLIESAFGRVVNRSSAGAQGPMQFEPATWRAYGLGGNVHDARDAILGAANYLHASGAPGDERRALFAYNRSTLYVDAVLAYARVMQRGRLGFATLYAWEASLPSVL
jgi:soluble lytic murein transglycosylase-like protein